MKILRYKYTEPNKTLYLRQRLHSKYNHYKNKLRYCKQKKSNKGVLADAWSNPYTPLTPELLNKAIDNYTSKNPLVSCYWTVLDMS